MPSHGPTEPPDEDHGWKTEYDKIMEAPEGKALLKGLCRLEGDKPLGQTIMATMEPDDLLEVETDDDALQAFVQMVYDRGIAHGHWLVADAAGHAALDEELAAQDRLIMIVGGTVKEMHFSTDNGCSCGDPNCGVIP